MKIVWNGELTPQQERITVLVSAGATIVAFAGYKLIAHLRRKASNKRVAKMVAKYNPECDPSIIRLKAHLDQALDEQRKRGEDILRSIKDVRKDL